MWVHGSSQTTPVTEQNTVRYPVFRERALQQRRSSQAADTHLEMAQLYHFWSHFLCRNFNFTMYSEFKTFAEEDAERGAANGIEHLVEYYDQSLKSATRVIPDFIAHDYVELVKAEKQRAGNQTQRIAFNKLRLQWRNGALDMKSRKKIDNLIDQELKDELSR